MPRRKLQYATPKHRPQNHIMLEHQVYEALLEARELLVTDLKAKNLIKPDAKNPVGWASFFQQAALCMAAGRYIQSVKANRYNRYGYFAMCPNCERESMPLNGKITIIWRITCPHCECDYVAVA